MKKFLDIILTVFIMFSIGMMTACKKEIEKINEELNLTGADFEKAAKLAEELDEKNEELEKAYELWEELQ